MVFFIHMKTLQYGWCSTPSTTLNKVITLYILVFWFRCRRCCPYVCIQLNIDFRCAHHTIHTHHAILLQNHHLLWSRLYKMLDFFILIFTLLVCIKNDLSSTMPRCHDASMQRVQSSPNTSQTILSSFTNFFSSRSFSSISIYSICIIYSPLHRQKKILRCLLNSS